MSATSSGPSTADLDGGPRGEPTLDGLVVSTPALLGRGRLVAGRYEMGERIGEGGHGAVYRGHHVALDVPVAIKVMPLPVTLNAAPPSGREPSQAMRLERFVREARTVARIQHRNVLHIHDAGQLDDGSPYLVTELIEGADLEQRLRHGRLSVAAAVDLGRQLFSALCAITDAGVHHRDVKPANLMLRREADGHVHLTLIDFGIAQNRDEVSRLTVTGTILGTPHYMSPEQLRGDVLDARADLYAASAVLYEALTGQPPFDGETTPVVIGKILSADFVPLDEARLDCPAELAALIARGLHRDRDLRPPSPFAFGILLDRLAYEGGLPTGALAWADDVLFAGALPKQPAAIGFLRTLLTPASRTRAVIPPRRAWTLRAGLTLAAASAAALFVALPAPPEPARAEAPRMAAAPSLALLTPQSAVALAPVASVEDVLDQGLEALARGETELALERYRAAVDLDVDRPEAHRGRGLAAGRAGFDDEAVLAFERYLALSPDAFDAERIRARVRTLRARRSAP